MNLVNLKTDEVVEIDRHVYRVQSWVPAAQSAIVNLKRLSDGLEVMTSDCKLLDLKLQGRFRRQRELTARAASFLTMAA